MTRGLTAILSSIYIYQPPSRTILQNGESRISVMTVTQTGAVAGCPEYKIMWDLAQDRLNI